MELTFSLLIIGVLSGAALTSLAGLEPSREDFAARRVKRALVFAQQWAMGTGQDTWMSMDTTSSTMAAFSGPSATPLIDPLTRAPLVLNLAEQSLAIQSITPATLAELHFASDGSPIGSDGSALSTDGVIRLGNSEQIRIVRNTGLIRVE